MHDALTYIEVARQNTLYQLENLRWHLKKLDEMRDAELERQGIDKEDWIAAVKGMKNGRA